MDTIPHYCIDIMNAIMVVLFRLEYIMVHYTKSGSKHGSGPLHTIIKNYT